MEQKYCLQLLESLFGKYVPMLGANNKDKHNNIIRFIKIINYLEYIKTVLKWSVFIKYLCKQFII